MSRRVVTASELLRGDSSTSSEDSNSEEESSPNLSPQDQAAIDSLDEVRPAFPVQSTVPRIEFDSSIMPAFFLPQNYRVTKGDIMNGRGRTYRKQEGNRRFRKLLRLNLKRYHTFKSTTQRSKVVAGIVQAVNDACPSGGFLRPLDGPGSKRFESLGSVASHEKTGHAIRDLISHMKKDEKRTDEWAKFNEVPKPLQPIGAPNILPLEMSNQQLLVLQRLEMGFDGPLEELLQGTQEQS